jgi:prepilin-type N-terminal cleavage/methylation domain-containing protein
MRMKHSRRQAFSLMELLVVLAIIGILVALTTAAVMRFRGTGLASATKTNLSKLHAKLREQWKGVTDKAGNDSLSAPVNSAYAASALNAGASFQDAPVKARYVQLRQRQAFPMSFAEAFWPDPAWKPATPSAQAPNAWQGYVKYLADVGVRPDNEASWASTPLDVQQAICLLMILERGPGGGGATAEDLGSSAVGPVIGSARGIIDGWKRPVIFTRQYGGQDASLAILSSGLDGKFGVDTTSPGIDPTTKLARDPTFAVVTKFDVRDNVLVTNP